MAVYERTYRGYEGRLTPEWSRFLTIPRYAYQQVFSSKMFIVFLVVCSLYPLFCAISIYVPHNLNFLKFFEVDPDRLMRTINQYIFPRWFMYVQGFLSFLLAFFVGPALISADMRNNGLPLYLSRPFSRTEYVLGKMAVLAILLSFITWIPGLLLFLFESYMMGFGWFLENLRMGIAIFVGAWVWILVLSLLSLAVSAYVRWKPVARITLIGLFFISSAFGGMFNLIFGTSVGRALNISDMVHVVWHRMFGYDVLVDFPLVGAWSSLAAVCVVCLALLARRVRAYEVVR